MTVEGIDLSNNNSTADWAGVRFMFAKATESTGFVDRTQQRWVNEALSRYCLYGAYHFAHPEQHTPESEARFFLQYAIPGSFWALDCESRKGVDPLALMGADSLAQWCDFFYDAVTPALGPNGFHYTFRSWADQLWPRLQRPWRWWLASGDGHPHYTEYAGRTVDIEQYGIFGGIDRNIAYTPLVPAQEDDMTPEENAALGRVDQRVSWMLGKNPADGSDTGHGVTAIENKVDALTAKVDALIDKLAQKP